MNLPRKKLPIGIQTFSTIREEGYYYVDKTPFIHKLAQEGGYYFLSRPRRFGKSLLLDTIDCLFSGREKLFEGLFIADQWDWGKKHPVVRISFNDGVQKHEEPMTGYHLYTLGYPNQEVETSLNQVLLPALGVNEGPRYRKTLFTHLRNHDLQGLEEHLKALFAGLPHDWYRNNPIAQYEGHYASVFYSHFAALGVQVTVEDASNYGKVDMAVQFGGHIYLFEFKVVEQVEGSALQQIKDKGYADKYRASGQPIHLIGVEFSKEQRQILAFEVEDI